MIQNEINHLIPSILVDTTAHVDLCAIIKKKVLVFSINILKNHIFYQYNLLNCISCVDTLSAKYRFFLAYEFISFSLNTRIRIKTFTDNSVSVESLFVIFINSNWWEREIWDLFGIFFSSHPSLRRLLTDYGFEGHALRKDFPLSGYKESRYDNLTGKVNSEWVHFSQYNRVSTSGASGKIFNC